MCNLLSQKRLSTHLNIMNTEGNRGAFAQTISSTLLNDALAIPTGSEATATGVYQSNLARLKSQSIDPDGCQLCGYPRGMGQINRKDKICTVVSNFIPYVFLMWNEVSFTMRCYSFPIPKSELCL